MTQAQPTANELPKTAGNTDALSPDAARTAYAGQVETALTFVKANRYAYGPKLRKAELNWDITGAEARQRGIVRIFITFRPSKGFHGKSGAEYVDIGTDNTIAARRVTASPNEPLPWVLITLAVISLAAAGGLIPTIFLYDGGDNLYVSGRTLWVRTNEPQSGPHVIYQANGSDGVLGRWAITTNGTGTELLYVKVTLINGQSEAVKIIIDEAAAEIRTVDGIAYRPINPMTRAFQTETLDPRNTVAGFLPLWNPITLNNGEQIEGYIVFEVPAGSTAQEFTWRATDIATVRY